MVDREQTCGAFVWSKSARWGDSLLKYCYWLTKLLILIICYHETFGLPGHSNYKLLHFCDVKNWKKSQHNTFN